MVLGSSPLARGLQAVRDQFTAIDRIIPARAGFTMFLRLAVFVSRDHPRSRGVYARSMIPASRSDGSSPLARGLPMNDGLERLVVGIIPARAGFTCRHAGRQVVLSDHPRSRGVYFKLFTVNMILGGSSPLARGLLPVVGDAERRGGIIPARAGFTSGRPTFENSESDHPRSRGVYCGRSPNCTSIRGSSPLARGLLPADARV